MIPITATSTITVFSISAILGIASLLAGYRNPRGSVLATVLAAAGTFLATGYVTYSILEGQRHQLVLSACLTLPWVAFLFGMAVSTHSNMQSFDRASVQRRSIGLPESLRRPKELKLSLNRRATMRHWSRLAVPKGLVLQAYDATLKPSIASSGLMIAAAVLWPISIMLVKDSATWGGVAALVSLSAIGLPLLQRRVVFGGVLQVIDDIRWYQAVDAFQPWIGSCPQPDNAVFFYRTGSQLWLGFSLPYRTQHTLVIAMDDATRAPSGVREIDSAAWKRQLWMGAKVRPEAS